MSRIGKLPIEIPKEVEVVVKNNLVSVKGKKGELNFKFQPEIKLSIEDGIVLVVRNNDSKNAKSLHGLTRTLVSNMIQGVSKGFEKTLEIHGVGYRAQVSGDLLKLSLGFSHPVEVKAPSGISVAMHEKEKNQIIISGIDKQLVGQFAANIRSFRPPEPYKGKGIRYKGEYVSRKAGKTAKSSK